MADVIRTSNEQDINTALAWLEGPWQAAENRRGAANAAAVIRALRDAHETPPASNSNDMAAEFQRWLNAKGGDKGLMAAFYAGYMIAIRGSHETSELRFHEGERQSYLKAVELSVASGLLGDGDRSDLLQMYQRLWPRAPADIRADAIKSENQTVEQMFVQCPCGCGSLIPWGPAQKAVPVETLPDTLVRWMSHDTWRCRCKSPGDINIKLCNYCGGCGTHRPEKKASEGPG